MTAKSVAWGVFVKPVPDKQPGCATYLQQVDLASPEYTWNKSPASEMLGCPLQIHEFSNNDLYNPAAQMFFFEHETTSPAFGNHWNHKYEGDVLFTRSDGKDINDEQLTCFINYIHKIICKPLAKMFGAAADSPEKQRFREIAITRFSAAGFHTYFEETKRKMMLGDTKKDWEGVASPVTMTVGDEVEIAAACGSCYGRKEDNDGVALLRCKRCKVRFYCDAYCQRHDWKDHKIVCRAPEQKTVVAE